jgi:hypothetical protein
MADASKKPLGLAGDWRPSAVTDAFLVAAITRRELSGVRDGYVKIR